MESKTEVEGDGCASAEDPLAFRKEVAERIAREEAMLTKVSRPPRGFYLASIVTFALLTIMICFFLLDPPILLIWLVIGILLYSYNFIILLIPTTTSKKITAKAHLDVAGLYDQSKELGQHLITKNKKLAVEMGLTVFLSGMVPLALSFGVIFGLGLVFALYFGYVTHSIGSDVAGAMVLQILLIFGYYMLIIVLRPQAQGITKVARSFRGKVGRARNEGRWALTLIAVIIAGVVSLITILFFGAIIFPGNTLFKILSDFDELGWVRVPGLIVMLAVQVVVMRHFQGIASRMMAKGLLRIRSQRLRKEVLEELDRRLAGMNGPELDSCLVELDEIKVRYYSIAIYDIVEQNIFGRWPIYLVTPTMRYVKDVNALKYVEV
ncbi:MAG: hypothetical protein NT137_08015 [Methanomassiliicoccales archaeon]|nr:hypothetical protein [Methanomassiliicoccales archaeon]